MHRALTMRRRAGSVMTPGTGALTRPARQIKMNVAGSRAEPARR
jgi:hypothetical protein